jgi:hypothetical protein
MKKHLFMLLSFIVFSTVITAQDLEPNIFGIRAGVNFSSVTQNEYLVNIYHRGSRKGFNFGMSYQRLLMPSEPIYIETGLYLSEKGFTQNYHFKGAGESGDGSWHDLYENDFYKTDLWYLQLPVLFNYHFVISDKIIIEPYGGIYLAYGVGGKTKPMNFFIRYPMLGGDFPIYNDEIAKSFDNRTFKKIDFGIKFGVGATFYNVHINIGYELGTVKSEGEYYIDYHNSINDTEYKGKSKVNNRNWIIQVGYSFTLHKQYKLKNKFNRIYPNAE